MKSNLAELVTTWWRDPSDGWLQDFLESRGMLSWFRRGIAGCGAALGVVVTLNLLQSVPAHPPLIRLLDAACVLFALAWVLRWLLGPWPTTTEATWWIVGSDAAITAACLVDVTPLAGLDAAVAFLLPGSFLIFYRGPRAQLAHVGAVVAVIGVLAARVAVSPVGPAGWFLAAGHAVLCLTVAVGILPVLQAGFWMLRSGAADSLVDPLTGLANRRGLDTQLDRYRRHGGDRSLCVFAVDLDDFKAINDGYGHAVGDEVLVRTAARIREALGPAALIARTGGEEFVAVDLLDPAAAHTWAERICQTIAEATDPPVTASVGVAVTTAHDLPTSRQIAPALRCADTAMYAAKNRGGNTASVLGCTDYAAGAGCATLSDVRSAGSPPETARHRPTASPGR